MSNCVVNRLSALGFRPPFLFVISLFMAIIMIIVEFITIIKLLFSQPVGFTFF